MLFVVLSPVYASTLAGKQKPAVESMTTKGTPWAFMKLEVCPVMHFALEYGQVVAAWAAVPSAAKVISFKDIVDCWFLKKNNEVSWLHKNGDVRMHIEWLYGDWWDRHACGSMQLKVYRNLER